MSHQPTLFIDLQIFSLLLNHFSCQFCSFTTDIGSETRPLSNNITLYYTGEEGRGGEGGKKEEGRDEGEVEREGGKGKGEKRGKEGRGRKKRERERKEFIIQSFIHILVFQSN